MEMMNIGSIKPYPKNAKKHPKKQLEQIAASIKELGFDQAVVVEKDGTIIIGHGRFMAARDVLGWTEVHVGAAMAAKGEQFIPVLIRDDLSPAEVKARRLNDNKLNESDWDMSLVLEELKEIELAGVDIGLTGFSRDLVLDAMEGEDDVPEAPQEPRSHVGDLYQLGDHRLLCGDATKLEDVQRLMDGQLADCVVTDPPYNTGMQAKDEKTAPTWLGHMFDDHIEDWDQFLKDTFANYMAVTKGDCAFYVFIDWRRVGDVRREMEGLMAVKNVIVWDKQVHGLGSDYKFTYELCVVGKKGDPEISNRFGLDYQDIWRVQRKMGRNEEHATAKPVELLEKPISHASKRDDIVLDLFGGSGSTAIACEKTGRKCYMLEKDPRYIDVIITRWEKFTGDKAVKLN